MLDAAWVVFARRGIGATSVEELASEAGFTRGAFYSNFADKDAFVLALIDDRMARTVRELDALYASAGSLADFLHAFTVHQRSAAEPVLFAELWLYAQRNPAVQEGLAAQLHVARDAVARIVEDDLTRAGIALPAPPAQLAAIVVAIEDGLGLHRALDPSEYPEDMFEQVIMFLRSLLVPSPRSGT